MELWFNQFQPCSPSPLKRTQSEESGYISADSDMVIDTLKNFKIDSNLDISSLEVLPNQSDISWCRVKHFKCENDFVRDYGEIPTSEKIPYGSETMSDPNTSNPDTRRPSDLILDFESLPDVLSQTVAPDEATKVEEKEKEKPEKPRKTSPTPSTSKKIDTEEKNVVLPSGTRWLQKCFRIYLFLKIIVHEKHYGEGLGSAKFKNVSENYGNFFVCFTF